MEKTKTQKRLIWIGLFCMSIGVIMKGVVDIHTNSFDFFTGFLIGLGVALMIGGFMKLKTKSV